MIEKYPHNIYKIPLDSRIYPHDRLIPLENKKPLSLVGLNASFNHFLIMKRNMNQTLSQKLYFDRLRKRYVLNQSTIYRLYFQVVQSGCEEFFLDEADAVSEPDFSKSCLIFRT